MAFGPLCLCHDDFFSITPKEINELYEGYKYRDEQAWMKQAWLAATIINSTRKPKDQVKPRQLLGLKEVNNKKALLTKEERQEDLQLLREEIEAK